MRVCLLAVLSAASATRLHAQISGAIAPSTPAAPAVLRLDNLGLAVRAPEGLTSWRANSTVTTNGTRLEQLIGVGPAGETYTLSLIWNGTTTCAAIIANLLGQRTAGRLGTAPAYLPPGWFTITVEEGAGSTYACQSLSQGVLAVLVSVDNLAVSGAGVVRPMLGNVAQAAFERWGRPAPTATGK